MNDRWRRDDRALRGSLAAALVVHAAAAVAAAWAPPIGGEADPASVVVFRLRRRPADPAAAAGPAVPTRSASPSRPPLPDALRRPAGRPVEGAPVDEVEPPVRFERIEAAGEPAPPARPAAPPSFEPSGGPAAPSAALLWPPAASTSGASVGGPAFVEIGALVGEAAPTSDLLGAYRDLVGSRIRSEAERRFRALAARRDEGAVRLAVRAGADGRLAIEMIRAEAPSASSPLLVEIVAAAVRAVEAPPPAGLALPVVLRYRFPFVLQGASP